MANFGYGPSPMPQARATMSPLMTEPFMPDPSYILKLTATQNADGADDVKVAVDCYAEGVTQTRVAGVCARLVARLLEAPNRALTTVAEERARREATAAVPPGEVATQPNGDAATTVEDAAPAEA